VNPRASDSDGSWEWEWDNSSVEDGSSSSQSWEMYHGACCVCGRCVTRGEDSTSR
jgi:formate hydrogenlyase subunit 6/NADH:ubiquinone oxidoreductase subunit I